jgi:hypothetical protein
MALHLVGAEKLGTQWHLGCHERVRSGTKGEGLDDAQQSRTHGLETMDQNEDSFGSAATA